MAAPSLTVPRTRAFKAKYILFIVYGLAALVAIYDRDLALLNSNSPLRQHFAPIPRLIVLHGIPGAIALVLGIFQFSNRLRSRFIAVHRLMGRIYVSSVFLAAPAAVAVGFAFAGPSTLHAADTIQACG